MKINFILTSFSPGMVGEKGTMHIRAIQMHEAQALVDEDTKILATRIPHERLARGLFPKVSSELARFVSLREGVNALFLQYKGPQLGEDGKIPFGAVVTPYLIEVEEYQCVGT